MSLERFIKALRVSGLEPEADTVADFFFLASRMPRLEGLTAPAPGPGTTTETTTGGSTSTETSPTIPPRQETLPAPARKSGLYTGAGAAAQGAVAAVEIEVPEAPALPGALDIARSLRPLSVRFTAAGTGALDEEATAEQTAHRRQLILAFQPRRERWFDVALVVEDSFSMAVWKKTIEAFERMLINHGAFRDVRRWRFSADGSLTDPAGRPAPSSALVAPDGRRIVLILTQGVSAAWQSNTLAVSILEWARRQPTAVVQLLPERLWENTRLGETKATARSPRPGLPNAQWDVEAPAWLRRRIPDGVALPVLTLDAKSLGTWAQVLMARLGPDVPAVFWSTLSVVPSVNQDAGDTNSDLAAEDRLDGFRRIASDDGFRLATALAAGPVTLPVLRLVNQTLFGESARQETLAQILLGRIVHKVEDHADPDLVYYDFYPGLRELFARSLHSEDRFAVRRQVTRYLQQHPDTTQRFRALVPHKDGKRRLPEWAMPFADDDEALLRSLGLVEDESGLEPVPQSKGTIAFQRYANSVDETEHLAVALERAGYRVLRGVLEDDVTIGDAIVFADPRPVDGDPILAGLRRSGHPLLALRGEMPSESDLLYRVNRMMIEAREFGRLYNFPDAPAPYFIRKNLEDQLAALLIQGTESVVTVGGEEGCGQRSLVNWVARREDVRRAFRGGIYWNTSHQPPSGHRRLWILDDSPPEGDRACRFVSGTQGLVVPPLTRQEASKYLLTRTENPAIPDFDRIYEFHEGYWSVLTGLGAMMQLCNPAVLVHTLANQKTTWLSFERVQRGIQLYDAARHALNDAPRTFLKLISTCRTSRVPAIVWRFMERLVSPAQTASLVEAGFLAREGDDLKITWVYNAFAGESSGVGEAHAFILRAYVEAAGTGLPVDDGYFYQNASYHWDHVPHLLREPLVQRLAKLNLNFEDLLVSEHSIIEDLRTRLLEWERSGSATLAGVLELSKIIEDRKDTVPEERIIECLNKGPQVDLWIGLLLASHFPTAAIAREILGMAGSTRGITLVLLAYALQTLAARIDLLDAQPLSAIENVQKITETKQSEIVAHELRAVSLRFGQYELARRFGEDPSSGPHVVATCARYLVGAPAASVREWVSASHPGWRLLGFLAARMTPNRELLPLLHRSLQHVDENPFLRANGLLALFVHYERANYSSDSIDPERGRQLSDLSPELPGAIETANATIIRREMARVLERIAGWVDAKDARTCLQAAVEIHRRDANENKGPRGELGQSLVLLSRAQASLRESEQGAATAREAVEILAKEDLEVFGAFYGLAWELLVQHNLALRDLQFARTDAHSAVQAYRMLVEKDEKHREGLFRSVRTLGEMGDPRSSDAALLEASLLARADPSKKDLAKEYAIRYLTSVRNRPVDSMRAALLDLGAIPNTGTEFLFDVFVSSHSHDREWTTEFLRHLTGDLSKMVGRDVSVSFAPALGIRWRPEASAVLVVVVSREYNESPDCIQEIQAFQRSHDPRESRILPVWLDRSKLPQPIEHINAAVLFDRVTTRTLDLAFPLKPDNPLYLERVHEVAGAIARMLSPPAAHAN